MKKLSVLLVAAIMVLALTMPAAAFENEFGGYFRTRFYTQLGFSGEDKINSQDVNRVDTRTRLFYTAKFSENLKFINQFEMNARWGENGTYGQVGADGANIVVKRSYVDFKLAEQRFTVGVQNFQLVRGYLFDDDAAGIKAMFKVNDAVYLPLIYLKAYEGGYGRQGGVAGAKSNSDFDLAGYVFYPTIYLNKDNTLKPSVSYLASENASKADAKGALLTSIPGIRALDLWHAGLEYDGKFDIFDFGATLFYQFGDIKVNPAFYTNHDKLSVGAYLADIFGGVNLGPGNVHTKFIYASGNNATDDPVKSGNYKAVLNPGDRTAGTGASYYWAEIMGYGIFDNQAPNGAPADRITNVFIGNLGGSYKVLPTLKFSADLWYAKRAENVYLPTTNTYSDALGTELDLVASYTIVDNLKLDLVYAYCWAGDVITKNLSKDGSTNPMELGAQLSLAF